MEKVSQFQHSKNRTNLQNEEKNEKIYQKFNTALTLVYLFILSFGLRLFQNFSFERAALSITEKSQ
jgi:hypothetical protein